MPFVPHLFTRPELLEAALTHPSYRHEHPASEDNQRLEFLGDAVVDLVVGELLYQARPGWSEGELSHGRAELVREETLAAHARALGLGGHLRMGVGAARQREAEKPAVLADVLEAVVGAVYLDGGLEAARAFVAPLFTPAVEGMVRPARDAISTLQELCQKEHWTLAYSGVAVSGPDHQRTFSISVTVGGRTWGPGSGSTKQAARRAAAELALADLAG